MTRSRADRRDWDGRIFSVRDVRLDEVSEGCGKIERLNDRVGVAVHACNSRQTLLER